ncbi:hypothetical protein GW17_00008024 [Ensete ventricosum]|nr:hypothetical protein GW17_00008024 [Ensete ventricosum]
MWFVARAIRHQRDPSPADDSFFPRGEKERGDTRWRLVFLRGRVRRRLVFLRWDEGEAVPRLSARGRGSCFAFLRGDEATTRSPATPGLPARGCGRCLIFPRGGQGGAAASFTHLVFQLSDEAAPRLSGRCLVFPCGDEALPRENEAPPRLLARG